MHARFVVVGGGLSGLAAGIRLARFHENVLLLEKHSSVGGLNSYYYRNNRLIETGLHAITNFADRSRKKAPLNTLLRQLKIRHEELGFHEQRGSLISFPGTTLRFSNDFNEFVESIRRSFPGDVDNFIALVSYIESVDPFRATPFRSARKIVCGFIKNKLLVEMLFCPICYYGSSIEHDVDFNQFIILFRSIFMEGLFRPHGTIKNLLDLLTKRYLGYGGIIRLRSRVERIDTEGPRVVSLTLADGDTIDCDHVISTVGLEETRSLLGHREPICHQQRLGFFESIFIVDQAAQNTLPQDTSCMFFNDSQTFSFENPAAPVDFRSGAITLPYNFSGREVTDDCVEVRTTHLASYQHWAELASNRKSYLAFKKQCIDRSLAVAGSLIGSFADYIRFHDAFTPLTVKRFTGKCKGAVYGSPVKAKDGTIGYDNLFLAGTDQGYLGIVGSMLSGVAMANRHLLMIRSS